jgi:hypothetical protein
MGATWIAKPVKSLSAGDLSAWQSLDWGPNLAPSQTPAWGRAGLILGVEPILVFSPERTVSALFFRNGSEAECVNGPVYDWTRIASPGEQNELIGMTVHALLQCRPEITRVTLRPRMAESDLEGFLGRSAFPADGVDRSATLMLNLDIRDEKTLFESLGPRIRHEVSRAERAGVITEVADTGSGIGPFWERCAKLYSAKQLWLPPLEWIQALMNTPDRGTFIVRSTHPSTGSLGELLIFSTGSRAFNLFAAETRAPDCPNLSLNAPAQWAATKVLRNLGIQTYDLNGISHPDAESTPGFEGVNAYKRKFKGREMRFAHPLLRFG